MNSALFLSAQGRIPRSQYWLGTGVMFLAQIGISVALANAGDSSAKDMLGILTGLAFMAISFVLAIKRFHDLGKSGWFSLLLLIPLVNFFIWLFWLGCKRGTIGPNRFGDDPLQKENTAITDSSSTTQE